MLISRSARHAALCALPTLVALILFSLLSTLLASHAAADTARHEEMRGLWVVRTSLRSPQAIRSAVAEAKSHNFNALFVQVRGRGDAWYHSDLEPRAEQLFGLPDTFDPLAVVIEEGHRAGLEVHAWLDTYLTWTGARAPRSPEHIMNAHPDWIARDNHGRFSTIETPSLEGAYVQPSSPEVQEHLFQVFTDVARRYDVDGIHFDFVRYPNESYDFADSTLARFKTYMDPMVSPVGRAALERDRTRLRYVHMFPREWRAWRRQQVTDLVRRISDAVHRMKPWVVVSAAVFANAEDARGEKGQDWETWLAQGYLDAVCPMAYSTDTQTVARQIANAVKVAAAAGRHVYAGIGSWRLSAASTAAKIARARAAGAQGVNLFSYDDLTRDGRTMRYLDQIERSSFPSRAGVPGMRWRGARPDDSGRQRTER